MEKRYHEEKRDYYFLKLKEAKEMLRSLETEIRNITHDQAEKNNLFESIKYKIKEIAKILEEDMEEALKDAFFGFLSALEKFFQKQRLSYEEYHLLAAAKILFFKEPPEETEFGRIDLTWY